MIYLDLDGPIVNWDKGVYGLWGKTQPNSPKNVSTAEALEVTKGEIWTRISSKGAKWWADLEPQPWAREFYDELCRIDEVTILSSPSHIPSAATGKTQWMQSFFDPNFRQYILTNQKDLLAKPGDILIDDFDKNVEAFTQAGGIGIIFPRPWNKSAHHSSHAVDKVLNSISQVYPRYTPPLVEDVVNY